MQWPYLVDGSGLFLKMMTARIPPTKTEGLVLSFEGGGGGSSSADSMPQRLCA
jgi:hypothetical protein